MLRLSDAVSKLESVDVGSVEDALSCALWEVQKVRYCYHSYDFGPARAVTL